MQIPVLIPTGMHQLHKLNASLQQSARDQAVVGKRPFRQRVGAVTIQRGFCLAGKIDKIRNTRLHPKRHFVLSNSSIDLGIAIIFQMGLIHSDNVVQQISA